MEEITLESIQKKLGFDPLNPPPDNLDDWKIRDDIPSIWAPLSMKEKAYLLKIKFGFDFSDKTGHDSSDERGVTPKGSE